MRGARRTPFEYAAPGPAPSPPSTAVNSSGGGSSRSVTSRRGKLLWLLLGVLLATAIAVPGSMWRLGLWRRAGASATAAASARASSTSTSASAAAAAAAASVGGSAAFELVQGGKAVPEFSIEEANVYRHVRSGATVLSLVAPQDDNKVFGATFRTIPKDDCGIPHILEHSVLCGSRKYPVKEPFVVLLGSSLNTFLNAFTYPDRTCYPVASQNQKDFENLVNVYLDAVLHPRALDEPKVLDQEGWHYELPDKDAPLTYKGVVYNEMKGVYSSPTSLMSRTTHKQLFPDTDYAVDFGGDPDSIPQLNFDTFKEFHRTHYHPSNALFYFYGDDNEQERLALLDEYLREFDAPNEPFTDRVQYQRAFATPRRSTATFPVSPGQPLKHMLTVNWVLHHAPLSRKDEVVLNVLNHILLGTSASVLRKALLESGLGESVIGGGVSMELLQGTFSVGLKGIEKQNVDRVERLVLDTLEGAARDGFDDGAILAATNSVEFALREFNTGSIPRGLAIMLGSVREWVFDRDPADVGFEDALAEFKQEMRDSNGALLTDMLRRFLTENPHRLTVEMQPDEDMEARNTAAEESKLAAIKKNMSPEDIDRTVEATRDLQDEQRREDPPEELAKIPRLTLEDLDKKARDIPRVVQHVKPEEGVGAAAVAPDDDLSVPVLMHEMSSNGVLYVAVAVDEQALTLEEHRLLPLLRAMLTEAGTRQKDQVQLTHAISGHTGGISAGETTIMPRSAEAGTLTDASIVMNPNHIRPYLTVEGKAVPDKVSELFGLMAEVMLEADFSNKARALEMLRERRSHMESSVISSGHSYGATRVAARNSLSGYLAEAKGGISHFHFLKELIARAETDWQGVQRELEGMRTKLMHRGGMVVSLTGDASTLKVAEPHVAPFLGAFDTSFSNSDAAADKPLLQQWRDGDGELLPRKNEGFIVPTKVNYVSQGGFILRPGDKAPLGGMRVMSRALGTSYIWDTVRVVGGAYGGFSRFNPGTGSVGFGSYRDPNLMETLDAYRGAVDFLDELTSAENAENWDTICEQAIIGAIGDIDKPLTPDARGFTSLERYLAGTSVDVVQQRRDQVLSTSKDDAMEFAQRLRSFFVEQEDGSIAVVGSKQALEDANEQLAAAGRPTLDLSVLLEEPDSEAKGSDEDNGTRSEVEVM